MPKLGHDRIMKRIKVLLFQEKSRSLGQNFGLKNLETCDDQNLEFLMYGKSAHKLPDCYRSQVFQIFQIFLHKISRFYLSFCV